MAFITNLRILLEVDGGGTLEKGEGGRRDLPSTYVQIINTKHYLPITLKCLLLPLLLGWESSMHYAGILCVLFNCANVIANELTHTHKTTTTGHFALFWPLIFWVAAYMIQLKHYQLL